ncbi:hypothetical protein KQX54_019110 [Cotesia glomerata]|uniref:Uncharacterized protein n=1 Tax=Cotesia glomerata TaxID=32391 RepID=A0AAV7IDM2_COTGL|nr:hypothetical protein KQX54_019110 [Cotesia glomerata]
MDGNNVAGGIRVNPASDFKVSVAEVRKQSAPYRDSFGVSGSGVEKKVRKGSWKLLPQYAFTVLECTDGPHRPPCTG